MRKVPFDIERRIALRKLGAVAATPFAFDLARMAYAAGPFNDYRAIVCVFLFGGNDSFNTVIPIGAELPAYQARRSNLAIPAAQLLPLSTVNTPGRAFALHPSMPEMRTLFDTGKAAIISNVGPLIVPFKDAQQYRNRGSLGMPAPPSLFSHSDQQMAWQSGLPDQIFRTGWGGRIADLMNASGGGNAFTISVSLSGTRPWLAARTSVPYPVGTSGPIKLEAYRQSDARFASVRQSFLNQIAAARGNLFEDEWGNVVANSISTEQTVTTALATQPALTTVFPNTGLGNQLKMIARMIQAGKNTLGMKRQVFLASMGGYDTHGKQLVDHAPLLTQLSQAVNAFYAATIELGVANNVTTFTASDFGRTLTSNGDGSDHGWGAHHFAIGGAVQGARFYGAFPFIDVGTTTDVGRGSLLATTSVDEYGATLAKWMGVNDTTPGNPSNELDIVFPNLKNFATRGLGFV